LAPSFWFTVEYVGVWKANGVELVEKVLNTKIIKISNMKYFDSRAEKTILNKMSLDSIEFSHEIRRLINNLLITHNQEDDSSSSCRTALKSVASTAFFKLQKKSAILW
jgi:hypothetical protein